MEFKVKKEKKYMIIFLKNHTKHLANYGYWSDAKKHLLKNKICFIESDTSNDFENLCGWCKRNLSNSHCCSWEKCPDLERLNNES